MSDPTVAPTPTPASAPAPTPARPPRPERVVPAVGAVVVLVAVLSLLDDLEVVESSPWLALALAGIGLAALVGARTVAALVAAGRTGRTG